MRTANYRECYDQRRSRQALDYQAPAEVYCEQVSGGAEKPETRCTLVLQTVSL